MVEQGKQLHQFRKEFVTIRCSEYKELLHKILRSISLKEPRQSCLLGILSISVFSGRLSMIQPKYPTSIQYRDNTRDHFDHFDHLAILALSYTSVSLCMSVPLPWIAHLLTMYPLNSYSSLQTLPKRGPTWTLNDVSYSYLFLVTLGLCCCTQTFFSCSEPGYSSLSCTDFSLWWLLLLWGTCSRCMGFRSCDTWTFICLRHVESSWTRNRTHVLCTSRWIPSHCATREVPYSLLCPVPCASFCSGT